MTMEIRDIEDIKDVLKDYQMARHLGLRDYSDYSVLTTVNEAMGVQVQYVEEQSKAAIEANSIWTATGDDLDHIVQDRGLTRQDGNRATGSLTFRTSTIVLGSAITIPIGTLATASSSDGTKLYFETTEVGTIDIGYSSVTVLAQSQETGTDGNVSEYKINSMPVYISGVSRVENTLPFSGGTDEESDEDLRERYIYAFDVNGKATLPLMEQHIYDLDSVRECQITNKYPGEIEIVVDTEIVNTTDQDVVDCIEENVAAGIVCCGKKLATIDAGVLTPAIGEIKSGRLFVRVESNIVSVGESIEFQYVDSGSVTRTAQVTIPSGSTKGDTFEVTMYSTTNYAKYVSGPDGFIYIGSSSYTILGGYGEYPYIYILPNMVLVNVQISIIQTDTPDPDLETKIEGSIQAYLDEFHIGDNLEFSDLVPWIYRDYSSGEDFVGIDQITSIIVTAGGTSITGFGQYISIDSDERVEPSTINIILS